MVQHVWNVYCPRCFPKYFKFCLKSSVSAVVTKVCTFKQPTFGITWVQMKSLQDLGQWVFHSEGPIQIGQWPQLVLSIKHEPWKAIKLICVQHQAEPIQCPPKSALAKLQALAMDPKTGRIDINMGLSHKTSLFPANLLHRCVRTRINPIYLHVNQIIIKAL